MDYPCSWLFPLLFLAGVQEPQFNLIFSKLGSVAYYVCELLRLRFLPHWLSGDATTTTTTTTTITATTTK